MPPDPVFCVIGLGNPGKRFIDTRHNVGFGVIKLLALRLGASEEQFEGNRYVSKAICAGKRILLCRPWTYMNLSGQAMAGLSGPGGPDPSEMLVILDDLALPLGVLRLRRRGSSGGQKGLESIIHAMNTENIPRLRCGIGSPPEGVDPSEFVLRAFESKELEAVANMAERAVKAVETAISEGFEAAMNRWNATLPTDAPETGSRTEPGRTNRADDIF